MTEGDTKPCESVKKNRSAKKSRKCARSRSISAEFDQDFNATACGGAVLGEKTMRSLALRRYVNEYLPARSENAEYSIEDAAYALIAGLVVGGKGIQAGEFLRQDDLLCEVFGLTKACRCRVFSIGRATSCAGSPGRARQCYFRIAGRIVKTARRLTVRLAGGNICAERQVLWKQAFAAAGRL